MKPINKKFSITKQTGKNFWKKANLKLGSAWINIVLKVFFINKFAFFCWWFLEDNHMRACFRNFKIRWHNLDVDKTDT